MNTPRTRVPKALAVSAVWLTAAAVVLSGCANIEGPDAVDRAQARVSAKEKAVAEAQAELAAASSEFCDAAKTYISALDVYGDVLTATAPTVGDVRNAGADLAAPRDDAFDGAEAAVTARDDLATAEQELAEAQAALAAAQGSTEEPAAPDAEPTTPAPLAPTASVDRVTQAEADFASTSAGITDETRLTDASEQFNSAVVALELAWLRLFLDTGCVTDEQRVQADAAVSAYTAALQQELATAGYYTGPIDGIYGPLTVQAVEDLQAANGLPVTGAMDKATTEALQAQLLALGGAAAQASVASTAAIQQTLKLVGFWDGPVDGIWTPELTEAIIAFQTELGVEPTGIVDAATVAAFQQAIADLTQPEPEPEPEPSSEPTS
ncbi:peptidoglycan-binding protein [Microbacterium sp. SS28]|uniref:peptidoglycan-binding protein n=1 Tax=Microbacterium sp. SS28 TaxID=2919948 RepID=UPI001FA991D5|nr:peptidoglycan-binding protein [Microbacterium sp. SS28]